MEVLLMDVFEKRLSHIAREIKNLGARFTRVEGLLTLNLRVTSREVDAIMASKATDDRAIAAITANTSATLAAEAALTSFAKSTADLTQALKDALANANDADDPAVLAAVQNLEKNNADLIAATPQVAAAVTANTAASGDGGSGSATPAASSTPAA